METNWYVVKVMPGKERTLNEEFNKRISMGKMDNITRFVCPTEKEFVVVKKKKVLREKVLYGGYLYFESPKLLSDSELKVIAATQNIMGIMGNKTPLLLTKSDVRKIMVDDRLNEHIESKKLYMTIGERVVINEGAFNSFEGIISDIKGEKVDVEVKIFGRNTVVSLTMNQIEKL